MAHTQAPTQSSSHMPEWLQIWYSISNRQQYRSPNLQEEKNKMENAKKKKNAHRRSVSRSKWKLLEAHMNMHLHFLIAYFNK